MRSHSTILALVLSVAIALSAIPAPAMRAEAATTQFLVINRDNSESQVPFQGFDGNPPKVYDINGDGRLEIIAQNDNQYVYVFDSITGDILFEAKTRFPTGWGARTFNGPEVSILQEGGVVKLIVSNSAAILTSYRFDLTQSTGTNFHFDKEWDLRLDRCNSNPGSDSKPVLGDVNFDGVLDIVASTEEAGVYAVNATSGAIMWFNCIGGGNAEPAIGDLTGDGKNEVVFGSDSGIVTAMKGRTGVKLWDFNARTAFNLGSGSMPVAVSLGQVDGVGGLDVVVGARDSHLPSNWTQNHAALVALNTTGQLLWVFQDSVGNPLTYTRPVLVDSDDDGLTDVYWGDWNTVGHKPPWNESNAWASTGPAHFYRLTNTGQLVWRQTIDTWWSNKDVPLADVDGDGVQEMLATGPNKFGHDGIWYLNTENGSMETHIDIHPYKVSRAPVIADLWGTGTMQWVVEVGPNSPDAGGPGILIYDTGEAYDSDWPHPPYAEVPHDEPDPDPLHFDSAFKLRRPTATRQEVLVKNTTEPIASVAISVNDGPWQPMSLTSRPSWKSTLSTPAGTKVEFLATSTNGKVSESEAFIWLNGDLWGNGS